jgi:arylsulfatase A-like enzyme
MLCSQGQRNKQRPWDEAVRVPFMVRWPGRLKPREVAAFLDAPDILPTLLTLCSLPVPKGVEGRDFSRCLEGGEDPSGGEAVVACYHPFAQFSRRTGGREYRAIRTRRYTYARSLEGPWLLYDNEADPYQMTNLAGAPDRASLQADLDRRLQRLLDVQGDRFLPGAEYLKRWNYRVDGPDEAVPYTN